MGQKQMLDQKKEFTKLIKESEIIAKKKVMPLTSDVIVNGAGPIVITDNGESGYDLRAPELRGPLAKYHPIKLASQLGTSAKVEFVLQNLADHYGFEKAIIEQSASCALIKLYECPYGFLPENVKDHTKVSVGLGNGSILTFGPRDMVQNFINDSDFIGMYLEYAHLVLFNHGHGQIARIEKLAQKALSTSWRVNGCWVKSDSPLEVNKLWSLGLMATEKQARDGEFCLPNSGFDYQYKDMLTRLLKAGN